jgi:hypothetical protein
VDTKCGIGLLGIPESSAVSFFSEVPHRALYERKHGHAAVICARYLHPLRESLSRRKRRRASLRPRSRQWSLWLFFALRHEVLGKLKPELNRDFDPGRYLPQYNRRHTHGTGFNLATLIAF